MTFEDGLGRPAERVFQPAQVQNMLALIAKRTESLLGAVFAYVHGSFVKEGPSRDIDVAIYFSGVSKDVAVDCCMYESAVLSQELAVPVDVHPVDTEALGLAHDIASGTLLFSRNKSLSDKFEETAVVRFMDFRPILRSVLEDLTADNHRRIVPAK